MFSIKFYNMIFIIFNVMIHFDRARPPMSCPSSQFQIG